MPRSFLRRARACSSKDLRKRSDEIRRQSWCPGKRKDRVLSLLIAQIVPATTSSIVREAREAQQLPADSDGEFVFKSSSQSLLWQSRSRTVLAVRNASTIRTKTANRNNRPIFN